MLLIKQYIKELYNSTEMVAVVLPGTSIEVGDIIKFKNRDLFGKPQYGHFINVSTLSDLQIPFNIRKSPSKSTQTHNSASGIT
ncbi:MAG: hypothetical protein PQJ60_12840, partial [Spirochaetales bacterium]|nr:hypothetical protein [Spirochaetales bacterium]